MFIVDILIVCKQCLSILPVALSLSHFTRSHLVQLQHVSDEPDVEFAGQGGEGEERRRRSRGATDSREGGDSSEPNEDKDTRYVY